MTHDPIQALLIAAVEEAEEQVTKAEQAYERAMKRLASKRSLKTAARTRLYTYNGLTKPREGAA